MRAEAADSSGLVGHLLWERGSYGSHQVLMCKPDVPPEQLIRAALMFLIKWEHWEIIEGL